MTDKELLKFAAKAAGMSDAAKADWHDKDGLVWINSRPSLTSETRWNPLEDDSQALRLAVKLGICFGPNFDGDTAVAFGREGQNICEDYGTDPYAATRRAIVRAAASMGKAMHDKPRN